MRPLCFSGVADLLAAGAFGLGLP